MKNALVLFLVAILLAGCAPKTVITTEMPTIVPNTNTPTTSFPIRTTEPYFDGVRVTFICEEGVLVTVGDRKILVDGLFRVRMPQGLPEFIASAAPPFDDIDLMLVTHEHLDHFDANLVSQYLRTSPDTHLISTSQVTAQLSEFKDRVITLDARLGQPDQATVSGIEVKAFYLSHGKRSGGAINFGYLVTVNGTRFFHTGDFNGLEDGASTRLADQLDQEQIDIAFVSYWMLSVFTLEGDSNGIASRYIIPIHYEFPDVQFIQDAFDPNAIFFNHYLQEWVMPGEE